MNRVYGTLESVVYQCYSAIEIVIVIIIIIIIIIIAILTGSDIEQRWSRLVH